MDHIDHAKGNFSNATEQVLLQKIKKGHEETEVAIKELFELGLQFKDILHKQVTVDNDLLSKLLKKIQKYSSESLDSNNGKDSP